MGLERKISKGYVPTCRRAKGTRNKITRDLREAGIEGAARIGSDGKGKDGLTGWMQMCARKYPKDYLAFLGKLLPLTIKADVGLGVGVVAINVVQVPRTRFVPASEGLRLRSCLPPDMTVTSCPEPEVIPPPTKCSAFPGARNSETLTD